MAMDPHINPANARIWESLDWNQDSFNSENLSAKEKAVVVNLTQTPTAQLVKITQQFIQTQRKVGDPNPPSLENRSFIISSAIGAAVRERVNERYSIKNQITRGFAFFIAWVASKIISTHFLERLNQEEKAFDKSQQDMIDYARTIQIVYGGALPNNNDMKVLQRVVQTHRQDEKLLKDIEKSHIDSPELRNTLRAIRVVNYNDYSKPEDLPIFQHLLENPHLYDPEFIKEIKSFNRYFPDVQTVIDKSNLSEVIRGERDFVPAKDFPALLSVYTEFIPEENVKEAQEKQKLLAALKELDDPELQKSIELFEYYSLNPEAELREQDKEILMNVTLKNMHHFKFRAFLEAKPWGKSLITETFQKKFLQAKSDSLYSFIATERSKSKFFESIYEKIFPLEQVYQIISGDQPIDEQLFKSVLEMKDQLDPNFVKMIEDYPKKVAQKIERQAKMELQLVNDIQQGNVEFDLSEHSVAIIRFFLMHPDHEIDLLKEKSNDIPDLKKLIAFIEAPWETPPTDKNPHQRLLADESQTLGLLTANSNAHAYDGKQIPNEPFIIAKPYEFLRDLTRADLKFQFSDKVVEHRQKEKDNAQSCIAFMKEASTKLGGDPVRIDKNVLLTNFLYFHYQNVFGSCLEYTLLPFMEKGVARRGESGFLLGAKFSETEVQSQMDNIQAVFSAQNPQDTLGYVVVTAEQRFPRDALDKFEITSKKQLEGFKGTFNVKVSKMFTTREEAVAYREQSQQAFFKSEGEVKERAATI